MSDESRWGQSVTVRARGSRGRLAWPEDVEVFCERAASEFARAIRLPEGIHAEAIGASYYDGVLELTIPCPVVPEAKIITAQVK